MTTPTNFVTRAQWGSSFDYSSNTRMPAHPKGVALHWEGSKMGSFTHDECDNHVRAIEKFHTQTKKWAGIAYNAIVCPHGRIYEGRGTKYRSAANGDVPQNNSHFAVCYLGGKGDLFTNDGAAAYIRAVQWLRADGGAGDQVVGHRDLIATECPGATIQTWLKTTDFSAGTTTPRPTAPVWGKPETWVVGGQSADVTRLGERLVVHLKARGIKPPYLDGPGPTFSDVDVKAVQLFQLAQWPGSSTDPGGAADGYPGPETFALLAGAPPVTADTATIRVLFLPTAGYNADNAPGVTRYKANTKGLLGLVTEHKPDLVGTTELSNRHINPMLPLFDAGATAYKRVGGSDGRYVYPRKSTTKHIAGGVVSAAASTLLNGDDKQAAWSVDEIDGVRVRTIVGHAENQDGVDRKTGKNADELRPLQIVSMRDRAITASAKYADADTPTIYVADTNSVSWAKNVMVEDGWTAVGPGLFTRWDDTASKTFDWGFINAGSATVQIINHNFGDHTAMLIVWTITK